SLTGDCRPFSDQADGTMLGEGVAMLALRRLEDAERDGHKGMVIGDKGDKLKRIGTEARQELEKLWDCKVFLELWVKVKSGWADNEAGLRAYGYE
ncbi:MAG: hypothetical protein RLZZ20_2342, partial [Pseudomonadota bacterium]